MNKVNDILHSSFGWKANAYPDELVVEQYLAQGHTDYQCAAALDAFCASVPPPPIGIGVTPAEWRSAHVFGEGGKWRALNTAQALGLQPADPLPDVIEPALTADEALRYAKIGRHIDGSLAVRMETVEATNAELKRREDFFASLPVDLFGLEPHLVYGLVMWGVCPCEAPAFGTGRFKPESFVGQTLRSYVGLQLKMKGFVR